MWKKVIVSGCVLLLAGCGPSSIIDRMSARADDMCIAMGNGTSVSMDFTVTKYSKHMELQLKRIECSNAKELFPLKARDWVR